MLLIVCLIVCPLLTGGGAFGVGSDVAIPTLPEQPDGAPGALEDASPRFQVPNFAGQDVYLRGPELERFRPSATEHILVFQNGLSMFVGAYELSADRGVIWIHVVETEYPTEPATYYEAKCYLEGRVSVTPAFSPDGNEPASPQEAGYFNGDGIEAAQTEDAIELKFRVSGEVFITADKTELVDPRASSPYARAFASMRTARMGPTSAETEPRLSETPAQAGNGGPVTERRAAMEQPAVRQAEETRPAQPTEPNEQEAAQAQEKEPQFRYPIHLSPTETAGLSIEWDNKANIGTVIGRFYLSQRQEETGRVLELQADGAVLFASGNERQSERGPSQTKKNSEAGAKGKNELEDILAHGQVQAIYLRGDVVMTYGQRTIRADEIYYEFETWRGIATHVVMRSFSPSDGIPIYVRAAKLRQLAENKLEFDDATVTTSEFCLPQISLSASKAVITDTTQEGEPTRTSFDAQLYDVRVQAYDRTVFYWPFMRADLERPDLPMKSASLGYDSRWGASLETRWYLARLLGLQEPEGTNSTMIADYFSRRGPAAGIENEYKGENYLGRLLGYIIHDTGEDRLGRISSRRNLEPPRELRGRLRWQHRQFLPYNWQLTAELSYLSDEHFLESFYRNEFYVGKEQETLVHLKRIEDNWGLSFIGKVRLNDFYNEIDQLPGAEYHWTGQSFLDDKLTFYSDSQAGRLRQRYASSIPPGGSRDFYSFGTTRNEVDMPLSLGKTRIVPFVAGTVSYEDSLGFYRKLNGATASSECDVWSGETGVRVSGQPYWRVFPNVRSELWDLNQLRHVIRPSLTAVGFTASDPVFEQRDTVHAALSQRLQTKRGIGENQRTVDWMRLDTDVTWVTDSSDDSAGADRFIWNNPLIPSINTLSQVIPPQDRRGSDVFGPRRNYVGADFMWRLSDTTAVLSDAYYDMQSGVVEQMNVGVSHMRWPNLQYYVGSRYLKRLDNGYGEYGSNTFTFAVTYVLDPRYTVVFSQQVDFDYGKTVRSDITLIRRYHRLYWGLTFSADESLDRQSIMFSLWPQGVSGLAVGEGKYAGLGGAAGY
jgi:hypothetical protein